MWLLVIGRADYPHLHTILDTGAFLLSGMLALQLWDLKTRTGGPLPSWLAITFATTAALETTHALVTVEWSGPLLPLAQAADALRPSTWPPAALLLPIGIAVAAWLYRRGRDRARWLAPVLLVMAIGLTALFYYLPRYTAPTLLGITRPYLIAAPLLWGVVATQSWRLRGHDRLFDRLVIAAPVLIVAHLAMLYSRAPHDNQAMIAHLGKLSGYLTLLLLVTRMSAEDARERIRVEAELRASQQKFSGLLESAPDAMVIVNREGAIVLINAQTERLFGYTRAELLGKPVETLVPERFTPNHPAHRTAYFHEPKVRAMGEGRTLSGRRKDGSEFPVEISLSPLETEEGLLVSGSIRDISERRKLEEQLRRNNEVLEEQSRRVQEASRLKSEFLANMSHELRTPLNAVIGFAEIIHDAKAGPVNADQKEFLGDILTSSQHLLRLINDVLDLAKVESGKMEFHPEAVDVERLVGEVRDVLRTMASAKRIAISTTIAPEIGTVVIDPSKLKQVLYNYLSNALKFTGDGGQVAIRVRRTNGSFRIEVEDSGVGIRDTDLHRLFEEFQQLDASAAKKHQGTGLGLALTRRIVEAQGGQVGVESTWGKGSVFHAVLPLRPVPTGAGPRVLVLDDDPKSLKLADSILRGAGYQPIGRSDGEAGLEALKRDRPDAIILDLKMPAMSGSQFLDRLAALPAAMRVPVIIWTVVPLSDRERTVLLSRAAAVVPKASGSAALLAALATVVPAPIPGGA